MSKETTTMLLTLVFMAIGILYQVAIGVIYQRMIQQADTLSGMDNKLLNQCKERFINCYKLNGGVGVRTLHQPHPHIGNEHQFHETFIGTAHACRCLCRRLWRV